MSLRIGHEKQERERLEAERLALVKIRDGLVKENSAKKEELRKMDEKLEAMVEEFDPIEETLKKDV